MPRVPRAVSRRDGGLQVELESFSKGEYLRIGVGGIMPIG
jgi:hypothetical protein